MKSSQLKNKDGGNKINTEKDYDHIIIAIYNSAFFNFGLLPTLLLLDEYEKDENYLQCYYIKSAIDRINLNHAISLETRWGTDAIKQISDNWNEKENHMSFDDYFPNVQNHKEQLKGFIKPYIRE